MNTSVLALGALLLGTPVVAAAQCPFTAERNATIPATSVSLARITAKAGDLRIEGRAGLQEIRVRGRACASTRERLAAITLRSERVGNEARLTAMLPESENNETPSLDLVIEVPATVGLDVSDSSGDVEILGVAGLTIRDSSGDIRVDNLSGSLDAEDTSGNLIVDGIRGDVRVTDTSGDVRVRNVSGGVLVENDSSGNIDVATVTGDVEIRRDSSGDIVASGVRGNFTVGRDGSGDIRHRDVAGRVQLPERR